MSVVAPVYVVGGGTAGSTLVQRLAARTDAAIVLVEPGPVSIHDDEPGFFDVLADGALLRSVRARAGTTEVTLLEACALGGGSAVNGMILSAAVPEGLEGLVRTARPDDAGPVGRALLARGGVPLRLWWNNGRWNPGRAALHLVEEGRIEWERRPVESISVEPGRPGVVIDGAFRPASAVVLCAGAIGTPLLLLRSGAGILDASIGLGLQNHPEVSVEVSVGIDGGTSSAIFDACIGRETASHGRRLLTIAYERTSARRDGRARLATILLDPRSRGSVRLEGGEPVVDFACLADEGDLRAMLEGTRDLARLATEMAAQGQPGDPLVAGSPAAEVAGLSDDALELLVRSRVGVVSHPAASCAGSVEGDGALRCLQGTWIADASAFAAVPSCTPASEVVMLARRVADSVGEALS